MFFYWWSCGEEHTSFCLVYLYHSFLANHNREQGLGRQRFSEEVLGDYVYTQPAWFISQFDCQWLYLI